MEQKKKIIYSAIKPTGDLTLGNYIGALKNWNLMKQDYDCFYAIANGHAITVRLDTAQLRRRTREIFAMLLACGLDPQMNTIYVQTHVHEHMELAWILNCYAYMGELNRMTQFKDKSRQHADNINAGLYTYPTLMAADILLYQANLVPVGHDQKQHVELTRDIAQRFNNLYGETFTLPEPYIPTVGARIMSLSDPTRKMSKSEEGDMNAFIDLRDEPDVIVRKFKRAVTDSLGEIHFDPQEQPGVSNLLTILSAVSDTPVEKVVAQFEGKGYGDLKLAVAEGVVEALKPIQAEFKRLIADKAYLDTAMREGAERAQAAARKTLFKAQKKVGFLERPRG